MEFIDVFEENCKKYSEVAALKSVLNNQSVTYGELNTYSASVYAYLKKKGIGREQMVFVYLPRDTRALIAMFGIIKAGAAFTLCEDTYPKDRVEFIRKDCSCVLTIDEAIYEEMMKEEPLYGHETTDLHDACFAVYTSGSTGNPKGVLHEYGKLTQIAESLCRPSPDLPPGSIDALAAPFNFVATVILVLRTAYTGMCLYILPYEIGKDVSKLIKFIEDEDVREAFLSLAVLKLYKNNLYKGLVSVYAGGEAYNKISLPENVCFTATYTSSEAGFEIATFKIDKEYDKTPAGKNSIGIEILILDEDGKRLPNGETGEICIKNEFTRGYINLPEKTAEAFVDGIFHTRDLGYINEDGDLMVCGRKDDMIKIDGNRIEPAEIEAAIKNELGISNAVAKGFVEENRSFICAYFIEDELKEKNLLKDDGSFDTEKSKLRESLPNRLPYYMLPTYYCVLPSYPVNTNGKLDKKQLKAPDVSSYIREYVAPSNEMEEKLCKVMAEVLGLERVGAMDDFYEIGGDSINAIRVIVQMQLDSLNVNMLLAGRTPQAIAKLYEKEASKELVNFKERNAQLLSTDQPLSFQQEYFCERHMEFPDSTQWNTPVLLKLEQGTDFSRLKKALDTVLKHHPVFSIIYTHNAQDEPVQRYNADKIFDTKIETVTEAEFEKQKKHLAQPFELWEKPLYRARLFKTENGGYLFCDFHHSIIDGTGIQQFVNDICNAYEGKTLKPDYYFVAQEEKRKRDNNEALYKEAEEYYERTYGKYDWSICLNLDKETEENRYGNTGAVIPLAPEVYESLRNQYGIGINTFFLTVACVAISVANKKENIMVSWIYNGRETLLEQTSIGAMLNAFYVGIRFNDTQTIADIYRDMIEQVKNNVYYSCYPYVGPQTYGEEEADLNFLQDLKSFAPKGELSFSLIDLTEAKEVADNLLDMEIVESKTGCNLLLEYNACAFKEETIEKFKKLFVKTAVALAENINNPNMLIAELMKKL